MQSIHKLTAGDGYAYLTRQVAALDATDRGHTGLGDYYTQQGESPGAWLGSALADVDLAVGDAVTEDQMAALFAEGLHPNADAIRVAMLRAGSSPEQVVEATRLGLPYPVLDTAPAFRVEVAKQAAAVNAALGVPRDTPLAAAERARIRTDVGRAMFTDEHGRPPASPRELASFIARHSRQSTTAVAGYDLTFSPVKSVSALWAIAPQAVADEIYAAHRAAVADSISWLEREAVYTRGGHAGVQQLDTTGLIAAAFDHRDSRAGDPDLHTHVAVANKVRVRNVEGTPGRWLALDGRVLFKATVSSSERYNTRLEAELYTRLGLRFTERADTAAAVADGRRSVREIDGIPDRLLQAWSRRRAAIDDRRAELAAAFQADHGRPPTPIEAVKLAQQATLETRDAKHTARSQEQQRDTWRAEAAAVLGSTQAVDDLTAALTTALNATARPAAPRIVDADLVADLSAATADVVAAHRSTWQVWHIRAEAERQVRAKAPAGADVDALVENVIAAVLHPQTSIALTLPDQLEVPDSLRRVDGASVYEVAGSQLYTSTQVLADEAFLVAAAQQDGGRTAAVTDVDVALLESVANGVTLNAAQAHLVEAMATSGRRVQLAIAPAGSGKTTAMAALTTAWTESGGTVLGLAPSAVAASLLAAETGAHADTLAKLTHALTAGGNLPDWANHVNDKTLIIVDEAGMASTADLAALTRFALDRGASIRLVGDDRQLASVAAGGVLRDIKTTVGAVTLTELIRFRDPAEGAASLALRTGDTAALGFYVDNDRVHVGDLATAVDHAYTAWATDRAAGLDAIMLAPPGTWSPTSTSAPAPTGSPTWTPTGSTPAGTSPSPTGPPHPRATWSSPAATTGSSAPARPTGSRTATGGPSPPSPPVTRSPSSTPTPAGGSPCPATTSPTTSSSATPPPCTAGKASPPTPATPSPPDRKPGNSYTSPSPEAGTPTICTSPPPPTETNTPSSPPPPPTPAPPSTCSRPSSPTTPPRSPRPPPAPTPPTRAPPWRLRTPATGTASPTPPCKSSGPAGSTRSTRPSKPSAPTSRPARPGPPCADTSR